MMLRDVCVPAGTVTYGTVRTRRLLLGTVHLNELLMFFLPRSFWTSGDLSATYASPTCLLTQRSTYDIYIRLHPHEEEFTNEVAILLRCKIELLDYWIVKLNYIRLWMSYDLYFTCYYGVRVVILLYGFH